MLSSLPRSVTNNNNFPPPGPSRPYFFARLQPEATKMFILGPTTRCITVAYCNACAKLQIIVVGGAWHAVVTTVFTYHRLLVDRIETVDVNAQLHFCRTVCKTTYTLTYVLHRYHARTTCRNVRKTVFIIIQRNATIVIPKVQQTIMLNSIIMLLLHTIFSQQQYWVNTVLVPCMTLNVIHTKAAPGLLATHFSVVCHIRAPCLNR